MPQNIIDALEKLGEVLAALIVGALLNMWRSKRKQQEAATKREENTAQRIASQAMDIVRSELDSKSKAIMTYEKDRESMLAQIDELRGMIRERDETIEAFAAKIAALEVFQRQAEAYKGVLEMNRIKVPVIR